MSGLLRDSYCSDVLSRIRIERARDPWTLLAILTAAAESHVNSQTRRGVRQSKRARRSSGGHGNNSSNVTSASSASSSSANANASASATATTSSSSSSSSSNTVIGLMQSPPVVTTSPHTSYDLIVVDCLHTLVAPYIGLGGVLSAGGSGGASGGGRVHMSSNPTNTPYQHNLSIHHSTTPY